MVIIDAGHGGFDPGGGSNIYFKEKDLTLKISNYMKKRFEELGIPSTMVRDSDITLDPSSRINKIAELGAGPNDILISNHVNNGGSGGGEVIYSIRGNNTLPQMIANNLSVEGVPIRNVYTRTGASGNDYYFILRQTAPNNAMIVEYGFADNADDTYRLIYNWPNLAEAVVKAVSDYLGVNYSNPNTITYIVKPNDSLYEIAKKYNTTISKIKELNNLTTDTIYPGAILQIN
ncbi:MAG: N-acetylmuramoyl-L-alanine amidase [Bacilli bacterium]|nr:N-acetylmuramoyl-L-alanine amidase [Bacilli bacterium]